MAAHQFSQPTSPSLAIETLKLFWQPPMQFWFVYFLFVSQLFFLRSFQAFEIALAFLRSRHGHRCGLGVFWNSSEINVHAESLPTKFTLVCIGDNRINKLFEISQVE